MSIIQTIRDKGAKISVALIALALVGFILTDYFSGRGRNVFSGSGSSGVGSVNGRSIPFEEFKKKVDQNVARTEDMYKQQGYPAPPPSRLQKDALDQTWNEETNRLILREEFRRLGMRIGKKERGDIVYGPNSAPEFIKRLGTDDKTGMYDPLRAKQQLDQIMKDRKTPQDQKDGVNEYIGQVDEYRMGEKYTSLFANSINYPRWFVEKQTNDNAQVGKISLVRMLYTDSVLGPDSAISISDKEIADYINKNKDKYKQTKSRSISFVAFSASPTRDDSADAKKILVDFKPQFDTAQDIAPFYGRDINAESPDVYFTSAQLPPVGKDSIIRLGKNGVFGPYLEGGSYVMLKMLDTKIRPDSVKARHILIKTFDPNTNQQLLDDSTAKKRIDSIDAAIRGGARFDSLAAKLSDDGSGARGGVLANPNNPNTDYYTTGTMVKEFNDFTFDGKTGDKKIVKTVFGYHLIEILDQKNFNPNYKIAYLAKDIAPSDKTETQAQDLANALFGDSKDQKSFDAAYEKTGKPAGAVKGVGVGIGPLDNQVNNMSNVSISSRTFVSEIYKAKLGEILKPEKVESNYIVAIVTEINDEGTASAAKARPAVEFELRKKKKAEMIKQKIGTVTTLEDAAAKLGKTIEVVDSLRMDIRSMGRIGNEPKVAGAAFNSANNGKVVTTPIEGTSGVYVIRVESIGATSSMEGSVEDQRKNRYQAAKQQQPGPVEGLKKAAKIKDKRSERF